MDLRIIAAAMVAAFIALGAYMAGTADAAQTCKTLPVKGATVELTVWGSTSCAMGRETARQAVDRSWPRAMRVKSPATGKRYLLHRVSYEHRRGYFSAVYSGHGAGRSTINVQVQVRG